MVSSSKKASSRSVFLGLEGCAKRLAGGIRLTGSHRDFLCSTTGFHIVVVAILHAALDALDVLAATGVFIGFVLFHFHVPSFLIIRKAKALTRLFCPSRTKIIHWER